MKKKSKKPDLFITKTVISKSVDNTDELDFVLMDRFKFNYEEGNDYNIIKKGDYYADAEPIEIDSLIKILQEEKEKGATHVQIETHHDHHGYDISSFEIRESSPKEIEEWTKERDKFKSKQEQIAILEKQIELIKKGK